MRKLIHNSRQLLKNSVSNIVYIKTQLWRTLLVHINIKTIDQILFFPKILKTTIKEVTAALNSSNESLLFNLLIKPVGKYIN